MPTWPPSKLRQDNPSFGRAVEHSGAPGVTRPPSRSARSCNKEPALAVFLRYCFAEAFRLRLLRGRRTRVPLSNSEELRINENRGTQRRIELREGSRLERL